MGGFSALAVDSSGNPNISYYDYTNGDLKYAYWNGSSWIIQTWASSGNVGQETDIWVEDAGYPYISFFDMTNRDVIFGSYLYAHIIDSESNAAIHTSLAVDSSNYPHISYNYSHAGNDEMLKYAFFDDHAEWNIEIVDGTNQVQSYNSLALDSNDNPHISYHTNCLKYAHHDGEKWYIMTVDSGTVGMYNSLALDSNDNPHISYHDPVNGTLKYATIDLYEDIDGDGVPYYRDNCPETQNEEQNDNYPPVVITVVIPVNVKVTSMLVKMMMWMGLMPLYLRQTLVEADITALVQIVNPARVTLIVIQM